MSKKIISIDSFKKQEDGLLRCEQLRFCRDCGCKYWLLVVETLDAVPYLECAECGCKEFLED